jgi:hypothetical protein
MHWFSFISKSANLLNRFSTYFRMIKRDNGGVNRELRARVAVRLNDRIASEGTTHSKWARQHYDILGFGSSNSAQVYIGHVRHGQKPGFCNDTLSDADFTDREFERFALLFPLIGVEGMDPLIEDFRERVPAFAVATDALYERACQQSMRQYLVDIGKQVGEVQELLGRAAVSFSHSPRKERWQIMSHMRVVKRLIGECSEKLQLYKPEEETK